MYTRQCIVTIAICVLLPVVCWGTDFQDARFTSVLTFQDWESGFDGWTATDTIWQVGTPADGPPGVYGGIQCAATVLAGNYPSYANSRLISPAIELPSQPQDAGLWLRYWQWFKMYEGDGGDFGKVEISINGGDWQDLSLTWVQYKSDVWSQNLCDLSDYSGETIQIAFHFQSNGPYVDYGWCLDDVSIEEGRLLFNNPEDFENGTGDMRVTRGAWNIGVPTSGPGEAHSGEFCAATDVSGGYCNLADSRLIMPPVELSATPLDGEIWLRYWQWFETYEGDAGDGGKVQISADGGAWEDLPLTWAQYGSDVWSQNLCNLSGYSGQTVRIAFLFQSNSIYTDSGWYIDDVSIEEGRLQLDDPMGFENGIGDFRVTRGAWNVGAPMSGPGGPHSGDFCVGTDVGGDYRNLADSRLILPAVQLSETPEGGEIWFRYWQWFETRESDGGDYGKVEISGDGGEWHDLPQTWMQYRSDVWSQNLCDLTPYAGQTVQIAFHFISNTNYTDFGWYIDDVSIEEGALEWDRCEDFEVTVCWDDWGAARDWRASKGAWQIGIPTSGPDSAHSGTGCVGTDLGGDYGNFVDSRFISPRVTLDAAPPGGEIWLRYWQWFKTYDGDGGDFGKVEISTNGGAWEDLPYTWVQFDSGVWSQKVCDLSTFAGQAVQIAFHFTSDDSYADDGWYIDDLSITHGPIVRRGAVDGFEAGLGNWTVDRGVWEVGAPTSGPGMAHSGSWCVATNIDGDYPSRASSRLVSAPIRIEPVDISEPVLFDFWHWYRFATGDEGSVEISIDGGGWQPVFTYSGSSADDWTAGTTLDLTSFVGSTARVSFHVITNQATNENGWYIDDVSFTNLDLERPPTPENLLVTYFAEPAEPDGQLAHRLDWNPVDAPDVVWYGVYRGFDEDFRPDFSNRIALTTEPTFIDTDGFRHQYSYLVSAIDDLGNESLLATPVDLVSVPGDRDDESPFVSLPSDVILHEIWPNPFNPVTSIGYSLTSDGHVRLQIFDVRGQLVCTLVDSKESAGYHQVAWRGVDDDGRRVAAAAS